MTSDREPGPVPAMPAASERISSGVPLASTTGLSPRVAAVLAYGGWWVSGALFWWIERNDAFVRFHAAQSTIAFGLVALLIAVWGAAAVLALSMMPSAFVSLMWAAGATWGLGVLLWLVAMWKAGGGQAWRIPLVGALARRWTRATP